VAIYGVSVDSVYSHGAFAKELGGLPFELIADFERRMVDAWGVRRTDMEGYDGVPRRTVFILDPEMKVRWRWITSPEQRLPDTDEVLAEAKKAGKAHARRNRKKT
jgi:peroxiredoxin